MKRKYTTTTIGDKVKAVELIKSGESVKSVANSFNTSVDSVRRWIIRYDEFKEKAEQHPDKKSWHPEPYPQTSKALYIWYCNMRDRGMPVNGPILQAKAMEFYKSFKDGPDFQASRGWLHTWKKEYGIRLSVCGESLSAKIDLLPLFKERLQKVVTEENLCYEQLYNADVIGLYYRRLPNKTQVEKARKRAPGFKVNKERLTILACANSTGGHKLPLFVVGKSAKPRALKNVSTLPVKWGHQSAAWMSSKLIKDWYFEDFVPAVKEHLRTMNLPEKAILILDNAPHHPKEEEMVCDGIRVMYLPPNVTSKVQPMDQNVLMALKAKYTHFYLEFLINEMQSNLKANMTEIVKKVNVLTAIEWLAPSWENVDAKTFCRSWKGLFHETFQDDLNRPHEEMNKMITKLSCLVNSLPVDETVTEDDVLSWLTTDNQMSLSDEQIIKIVQDDWNSCEASEEICIEFSKDDYEAEEMEHQSTLDSGVFKVEYLDGSREKYRESLEDSPVKEEFFSFNTDASEDCEENSTPPCSFDEEKSGISLENAVNALDVVLKYAIQEGKTSIQRLCDEISQDLTK